MYHFFNNIKEIKNRILNYTPIYVCMSGSQGQIECALRFSKEQSYKMYNKLYIIEIESRHIPIPDFYCLAIRCRQMGCDRPKTVTCFLWETSIWITNSSSFLLKMWGFPLKYKNYFGHHLNFRKKMVAACLQHSITVFCAFICVSKMVIYFIFCEFR